MTSQPQPNVNNVSAVPEHPALVLGRPTTLNPAARAPLVRAPDL